jgi:hypothetical protein
LRYLKEGEEEAAAAATTRKPRQPATVPDGAEEEEATAADLGRGKGGARAVFERFIVTSRTLARKGCRPRFDGNTLSDSDDTSHLSAFFLFE